MKDHSRKTSTVSRLQSMKDENFLETKLSRYVSVDRNFVFVRLATSDDSDKDAFGESSFEF